MTKQNVTANLGKEEDNIKSTDVKVDTSPENEEEAQQQDDVKREMGQEDATVSESDAEKSDEAKDEEDPQDVSSKEEWDDGNVDVDEEKPDTEKIKEEAKEEGKKEALEEYKEKYKPNEQKSENIKLHKEKEELTRKLQQASTTDYLVTREEDKIFGDFFESKKDILPKESKESLMQYRKTGDEKLIYKDSHLQKLNSKLQTLAQINPKNSLIDLKDRLESAYWLAFKDDILESNKKQTQVKVEMNKQEEDKIVETGQKASSPKVKRSYSPAQKKIADAWQVELK